MRLPLQSLAPRIQRLETNNKRALCGRRRYFVVVIIVIVMAFWRRCFCYDENSFFEIRLRVGPGGEKMYKSRMMRHFFLWSEFRVDRIVLKPGEVVLSGHFQK